MADNYDAQNNALIQQEARKLEKARVKAEALEENMEKTLTDLLKQASVKKTLARDAMEATRNPQRREEIFDKASGGLYQDDREVVTGEAEQELLRRIRG